MGVRVIAPSATVRIARVIRLIRRAEKEDARKRTNEGMKTLR